MSAEVYKMGDKLDSSNAATEQPKILAIIDSEKDVVIDMSECKYVSSAGLRVLLSAHKTMSDQDKKMTVINVNDAIMKIFEITGFSEILTIG